jgi:hypothetical protein
MNRLTVDSSKRNSSGNSKISTPRNRKTLQASSFKDAIDPGAPPIFMSMPTKTEMKKMILKATTFTSTSDITLD